MGTAGRFSKSPIGADAIASTAANSGSLATYAMAALNTGLCARFTAEDARDIKSFWINFFTVTSPGTIRARIETIDKLTGKPSGTLYDANAQKDFTPSGTGWNQVTFDTLPTTGLVPGDEYAIVLLTTVAGTTMTLRSHIAPGSYPVVLLTAADGTTRSNFAEVGNSCPMISLVMEDDSEEAMGMCPFSASANTNVQVYGTRAFGVKFVVPTGQIWVVKGVEGIQLSKTGSPGDLRCRILDNSDVLVSGCTRTVDKDSLSAFTSTRRLPFRWPKVNLPAGTYRAIVDQPDTSFASTNRWNMCSAAGRSNLVVPAGFIETATVDITASPITWVDNDANEPAMALILDDIQTAAGGAGTSALSVTV